MSKRWKCTICGHTGGTFIMREHVEDEHKDEIFEEEYSRYLIEDS